MGMRTVLQILVLVACLAAFVTAQRANGGRGGRRRGNRRRDREPNGERLAWTRTLSDGVTVIESALIASEHNVIIFKSEDNSSNSLGFQTSQVYYGYDGDEPLMAISTVGRRRGKPCFLTTPQKSYNELVNTLRARNGTTITTNTTMEINAQVGSMNGTLARSFSRQNPLLRRVCSRNKYYDTRVTGETIEGEETRILKTLAADNEVEITFPVISRQRVARRQNRQNRRNRQEGRQNRRQGRGNRRANRRGNRAERRQGRANRRNRNRRNRNNQQGEQEQ